MTLLEAQTTAERATTTRVMDAPGVGGCKVTTDSGKYLGSRLKAQDRPDRLYNQGKLDMQGSVAPDRSILLVEGQARQAMK